MVTDSFILIDLFEGYSLETELVDKEKRMHKCKKCY